MLSENAEVRDPGLVHPLICQLTLPAWLVRKRLLVPMERPCSPIRIRLDFRGITMFCLKEPCWSGSRSGSRHPRPLRTVRETSASYGSSLPNAPHRTRFGPISVSCVREAAGGSWRATTPGCRTSSSHRNSAIPDGGRATAVLPPASLAGTPDTCHLESSIKSRSGPVPQECGPASRPSVLPDTVPTPDRTGWLCSVSSSTEVL